MGPGENAGAVDIGSGYAIAFKVESHNHPSAVEPFQGAATGVGGILRDVFALGARPIAILDSLRFGELDSVRSRHLLDGAVRGIGHYGNSIGVANVGGEIYFEAPYEHNCLVNAMCVGIAKQDDMVRAAAAGVGNAVVLMGASTGRDGIGGASVLASAELGEGDEAKRPTVQIGDPFEESKVLECCLELLGKGLLVSLQDLGAAGPDLLGRRDGLGRRGRDRPRRGAGAAARGRHGALRDHGLRVPGADARRGRAGEGRRGARGLREMADRRGGDRRRHRQRPGAGAARRARSSARCRSRPWSTAARSTTSARPSRRAGSTATGRRSTRAPRPRRRCWRCSPRPASPPSAGPSSSTTRWSARARCAGPSRPTPPSCRSPRPATRSRSRSTATAAASPATPTPARSRRCSSAPRTSPASAPSRSA